MLATLSKTFKSLAGRGLTNGRTDATFALVPPRILVFYRTSSSWSPLRKQRAEEKEEEKEEGEEEEEEK